MAIEITNFNYPTDPSNNISEVYDWLVENASEYFPGGIEKVTDTMRVHCYPIEGDTTTCIAIPVLNNAQARTGYVQTKYGGPWTVNPNGYATSTQAYRKAVKTSCGIALMAHGTGATWYVSRTQNGNVCTYAVGSESYNGRAWTLFFADLENSPTAVRRGGSQLTVADLYDSFVYANDQQVTTLLPMVFNGGTYSTDLCMTPFTQAKFAADLQKVLIDGTEYIYDGFVALKG